MKLRPGNAQHQGAREAQQDSFGFSDLEDRSFVSHAGFLGVVCDGMGGMSHGGAAGHTAVHALLQSYAAKRQDEPIYGALLNAIRHANDAVVALARDAAQVGEVGTTAAVAVVHGASLHWITVGDSRVYLWRDGHLTQINADHVYAAELDAKVVSGQISEQEAREDPDRDALTSHLGSPSMRHIDRSVQPYPLFEGDRVLVCSDGLYRALTLAEIAAPLADNPQRACETLIERAVAKQLPRQDNMTVLVIGLDADGVTTGTTSSTPLAMDVDATRRTTNAPSSSARRALIAWTVGAAAIALVLIALAFTWSICCRSTSTHDKTDKHEKNANVEKAR